LVLDIVWVTYFLTQIRDRPASDTLNDVGAYSVISSPQQAVSYISKQFLIWRFMQNFILVPYFLFFSGFQT